MKDSRVVRRGGQKSKLWTTELLFYSRPPVFQYYQFAGSSSDTSSVVITVNAFLQIFPIIGRHMQKYFIVRMVLFNCLGKLEK